MRHLETKELKKISDINWKFFQWSPPAEKMHLYPFELVFFKPYGTSGLDTKLLRVQQNIYDAFKEIL